MFSIVNIDMMNVSALDLNLLKAFAALYAERHVSKAAKRVGLAQPSMSNALARLREVFEDPLFVRGRRGMVPTERAEAIAPRIDAALGLIADALAQAGAFDPATAEINLTIAVPDNIILSLAPAICAQMEDIAPGLDLRFVQLSKGTVYDDLDDGRIDAAIGHFPGLPARFHRADTKEDRFVLLARKGHPARERLSTLDGYCEARHVLVTFNRDMTGRMDTELKAVKRERRVVLVLEQFAAVPHIVACTDYIATVPLSVAEPLAEMAGCEIHDLPLSLPPWSLRLIWHQRTQTNPGLQFGIAQIAQLL